MPLATPREILRRSVNFGLIRTTSGLSNFVNELKTEHLINDRRTMRVKLTPSLKEHEKNVSKLRKMDWIYCSLK